MELCVECGGSVPCKKGHTAVVDISGSSTAWLAEEFSPERQDEILRLMNEMIGIEASYTNMEADDIHWGYRPYPIGGFGRMLQTAIRSFENPNGLNFLEVGSGPGTKILFAKEVFGIASTGFDIDPKAVRDANEMFEARGAKYLHTWIQDAEAYSAYDAYDIVFSNRPLRDYDREVQLEQRVFEDMLVGSVLILGNPLSMPAGWELLEQGIACAVWKKVCRCKGAEDFLDMSNDPEAPPFCKLCGRSIGTS
jgi:hypothetical protein